MEMMVKAMKSKVGNPLRKLVLIKLADNANDKGECWPSYKHIADHCEISRRSAMAHVKVLEDDGFLKRIFRKGEKGNSSNVIVLSISAGKHEQGSESDAPVPSESPALPSEPDSPPSESPALPPSESPAPRTSHSSEPVNEPVKKTLGGDSKKPDPIERDFEQLWQIKPDRGGNNPKRTALSAYRARRKEGHTHDEITAGLIRYTQQCAAYGRLGTEYVKQMATFLSKNLFFKDPWEIKPDAASRTDHKKPNAADKLRSDFERKWGDRADDMQTVS